jgi:hypothetical protein
MVRAIEAAMAEDRATRQLRADGFLRTTSWDRTADQMRSLIDATERITTSEAVG